MQEACTAKSVLPASLSLIAPGGIDISLNSTLALQPTRSPLQSLGGLVECFRDGKRDWLLVLLWALGLRLLVAALTADTYDPDEFVVLLLSRDFAHGTIPYRDFMFFHPPGVLVLFRALQPLMAWWWPSGRLITLFIDSATAVMVWKIGTLLYGRREALTAGLIYGASPLALICAVRVGQDPLITALGMGGLVLLLSRPSIWGAILAGACLGLALWIKYPAILFLPVYLLAAPRRWMVILLSTTAVGALTLAPFIPELSSLYHDTIGWQLLQRAPADLLHRAGGLFAFWLLLNPLTVYAIVRRRHPLWLVSGFAVGGLFFFASQVYYHYFMPMVPFAALLAAPIAVKYIHRFPRLVAAAAITLSMVWALDINSGSDPTRLFISASRFSTINKTVHLIDSITPPGQGVLTDQLEYAYLARRHALSDYFWNMHTVVGAHSLEQRLPSVGAVVLTDKVAPTYPTGFTSYLRDQRYPEIHAGTTDIWVLPHANVAALMRHARDGCISSSVSGHAGRRPVAYPCP